MIRSTLQPLLDVLESFLLSTTQGFTDYYRIYYCRMRDNSRLPTLVLKVLAASRVLANASFTSCWSVVDNTVRKKSNSLNSMG